MPYLFWYQGCGPLAFPPEQAIWMAWFPSKASTLILLRSQRSQPEYYRTVKKIALKNQLIV
jgi:hypothetical protein